MFVRILLALGVSCFVFGQDLTSPSLYHFAGRHFLASYSDCDIKALTDLEGLVSAMDQAVEASGATILDRLPHVFPPNALTAVYLLSESHASIHTYPEYGSCFVDLFTCGQKCSAEQFDAVMRAYLQPKSVNARFFHRTEETTEILYAPPLQTGVDEE